MAKRIRHKELINQHPIMKWTGFAILLIYAFTLIFSLGWALLSSLKEFSDFRKNLFGLPQTWMFSNYATAFQSLYVPADGRNYTLIYLIINSLMYAGLYTVFPVLANIVVAYACAKYKSKLCEIVKTVVILRMVIPIVGGLASSLTVSKFIGTYDNPLLAAIFQFSPQGAHFLIFLATFQGISNEYMEAARIDGAGHAKIMFSIMLPLARNTIIAVGIMVFIGCWNDWETAMVWFPSYPTLAYGLYRFQFSTGNATASITLQLTACIIAMIPMLIIFMFFKDKLVGNISMGGLKG